MSGNICYQRNSADQSHALVLRLGLCTAINFGAPLLALEELRAASDPERVSSTLTCGAGVPATRLLIDAGFVVTRVDISEVQIERARSLVPDATFICADTCPALTPKRRHVLETRLKRYHQFSGTRSGRLPGRRA